MSVALFYPHFYLSNDLFLRHQLLYMQQVLRVHASDRSPRDCKEVKQFLEDTHFLKSVIPTVYEEETALAFKTVLERAYKEEHPLYIQLLGKYGKERTSTKTFHFCRATLWPDLVKLLEELGLATVDSSGEWCFSTRMMEMALVTCMTVVQQRQRLLPRCTDLVEYDDLAVLLEGLPVGTEHDGIVHRAQLDFSYSVPQNLASASPPSLNGLRERLLPLTSENFNDVVLDTADALERTAGVKQIKQQLHQAENEFMDINRKIGAVIREQGEEVEWAYGRYCWYLNPESQLAGSELKEPIKVKNLSLRIVPIRVASNRLELVRSYPGSFLWAQEPPTSSQGLMGRWFNWFK